MKQDTTDYRQIAFKLQSDIEQKEWEFANSNLPFLKEMKDRLIKGETDVTQKQYAMNMIDDWIEELEEIMSSKL